MKKLSYLITVFLGMLLGGLVFLKLLKHFPELLYSLLDAEERGGERALSPAQRSRKMKRESYDIDEKDDSFI